MKDIHEVLRRKQAKYAQLAKQIEALQQAAEKLREVAPLLAENEEDDNVVLAEMDDETAQPAPWQPRRRLRKAAPPRQNPDARWRRAGRRNFVPTPIVAL